MGFAWFVNYLFAITVRVLKSNSIRLLSGSVDSPVVGNRVKDVVDWTSSHALYF